MSLSNEHIQWAYRLFFDREPEDEKAIEYHLGVSKDTRQLRVRFLSSQEFKENNVQIPYLPRLGIMPPMSIDLKISDEQRDQLMKVVQEKWEKLGASEPHWSVLIQDDYKTKKISENKTTFYDTGKIEAEVFEKTLMRNGFDLSEFKTCLELGCGVGRITRWLAQYFEMVHALDISKYHLEIAEEHTRNEGIENIQFHRVNTVLKFLELPKVDCFFSLIALQHNPPPVAEFILEKLCKCLNKNGIGYFQIATYNKGYKFDANEYLTTECNQHDIEMHFLPQKRVFELLDQCDCAPIEVVTDQCTGGPSTELSNTFFVQKRTRN